MRAEDADASGRVCGERAQAALIGDARRIVDGDDALKGAQRQRAARLGLELGVMEVGVPACSIQPSSPAWRTAMP